MKSGCLLARLAGLPGIRFCPLYSSIPGGHGCVRVSLSMPTTPPPAPSRGARPSLMHTPRSQGVSLSGRGPR